MASVGGPYRHARRRRPAFGLGRSPYGDQISGLVDNDWVYDWYAVDWSTFLSPYDDPLLTAVQVYADQGSRSLAVKAVELCV